MEQRTELKEKRNNQVWFVFLSVYSISLFGVIFLGAKEDNEIQILFLFGVPLLFVVYRSLTYTFNSLLLFFFRGEKRKIDRLKGRVTPIYKIVEAFSENTCYISKYEVQYTKLALQWSLPFSVLFEEQEYIKLEGYHFNIPTWEVSDLESLYEERNAEEKLKYNEEISAKTKKQQKIDNLNKVFNENYK